MDQKPQSNRKPTRREARLAQTSATNIQADAEKYRAAKDRLDNRLEQRGILKAARAADWHPYRYRGKWGWRYPVPGADGNIRTWRWKAADPDSSAKYIWIDGKPAAAKYYAPNGFALKDAIAQDNGTLYIANGEPAVLAYHSAGIRNVLSWFGEGSVPKTLASDCKLLGAARVIYLPDRDEAGRASGAKVRDRLAGSMIHLEVLDWADAVPDKGDANDLWIACKGDTQRFRDIVATRPPLELPPPPQKPIPTTPRTWDNDEFPPDYVSDVIKVLERQPGFKLRGSETTCCSPLREDKNPSFSFNTEKLVWKDFATGESGGIVALGRALGIDIADYREREPANRPPRRTGKAASNTTKRQAKQIDNLPDIAPTPFTADIQITTRYLDETLLDHRTLLVRSPMNTGKTQVIIDYINRKQPRRILWITHLRSLAGNTAERMNAAIEGEDFRLYSEGAGGEIKDNRVICSINSIYRVNANKPFDLIIWDEMEQGIPYSWGDTMSGAAVDVAFTAIKRLIRQAGQFIGLDAHLSDITATWVRSLRPDVHCLRNTYRHEWGTLTMHTSEAALIAAAEACADQHPDQPVVITTGSRNRARVYTMLFEGKFGADRVIAVHGWNSGSKQSRHFLDNINEEIRQYRVVIVSPTVGTGVDVHVPVAGVFGYFPGHHLTPNRIAQQVVRFRHADQYNVYIPYAERDKLETSAEALLERERSKAKRTAALAHFKQHDVPIATAIQGEIMQLWASYTAEENRQKANMVAAFIACMKGEGFDIQWNDTDAPGMKFHLKMMKQALKTHDDTVTLAIAPVSPEQMDAKRRGGDLTEEDFLGQRRWQIENTTGQSLDETLLERYRELSDRQGLVRFTDYLLHIEISRRKDRREREVLPMKRQHDTVAQILFERVVHTVFGEPGLATDKADAIDAATIEQRMGEFLVEHMADIQLYMDGRSDLSDAAIAILRRILKRFNVWLVSDQARRNGKRVRVYWIDQGALAVLREHAAKRLLHLSQNPDSPYSFRELRQFMQKLAHSILDGTYDPVIEGLLAGISPAERMKLASVQF